VPSDNDNSNVVLLRVDTTLDLPLDRVLEGARQAELEDALVIGWEQGRKFYLASQTSDIGKLLVLLERAKALLVRRLEESDEI
jgi:hypothetical protein